MEFRDAGRFYAILLVLAGIDALLVLGFSRKPAAWVEILVMASLWTTIFAVRESRT